MTVISALLIWFMASSCGVKLVAAEIKLAGCCEAFTIKPFSIKLIDGVFNNAGAISKEKFELVTWT